MVSHLISLSSAAGLLSAILGWNTGHMQCMRMWSILIWHSGLHLRTFRPSRSSCIRTNFLIPSVFWLIGSLQSLAPLSRKSLYMFSSQGIVCRWCFPYFTATGIYSTSSIPLFHPPSNFIVMVDDPNSHPVMMVVGTLVTFPVISGFTPSLITNFPA